MSKQTAVEWLFEQVEQYILTHGNLPFNVLSNFKKQAKAMEREQIIDAYRINPNNEIWSNSGIDYYNETYKGGEQ